MKRVCCGLIGTVVVMSVVVALGQQRVARVPSAPAPTAPAQAEAARASQGEAALQRAAATKKYLLVFFFKDKSPQTDAMWSVFQPAAAKLADSAEWTAVQATSPAEKAVVDRFGVSRAPMPLVLAIAPNGAVTKAFTGKLEADQLRTALVSPCTQQCIKALQDRKLVLLCVQGSAGQTPAAIPRGVQEFQADPNYAKATEVVLLDPADKAEAKFLQELQVDGRAAGGVTVLMSPPGTMIGKFASSITKEQIVAQLAAAQSSCCPGGKCGPNGCGPQK